MAVSTVIAGNPSAHRAAQVPTNAYQGALALDWANAQAISTGATSASCLVFDATYDRIVVCSVGFTTSGIGGAYFTVTSTGGVAVSGAGSLWLSVQSPPLPVYVPAGMIIAALQGATAGSFQCIPALRASAP